MTCVISEAAPRSMHPTTTQIEIDLTVSDARPLEVCPRGAPRAFAKTLLKPIGLGKSTLHVITLRTFRFLAPLQRGPDLSGDRIVDALIMLLRKNRLPFLMLWATIAG